MVDVGTPPAGDPRGHPMKQYLLSMYQPDGHPPPSVDLVRIMDDLGVIKEELEAIGAFVFTNGLEPASTATVLRLQDGDVLTTDGPFVEGKEHLGGFWVINAPDLDAALEWANRITRTTTLPIEVRPFRREAQD